MNKDFIPRRNADLNSFEKNFLNKLERYSSVLKLRKSDTESAVKAIEANKKAFSEMNLMKAKYKSVCELYETTRKKSISEIRNLSKLIRASLDFEQSHGADLGILHQENKSEPTADLKPVLKIKSDKEGLIIKYVKKGTHGLVIYSKIQGDSKFKYLAHAVHNTYTDKRGKTDNSKPEAREYYGYYFFDDKEVGKQSDVVRVIIP